MPRPVVEQLGLIRLVSSRRRDVLAVFGDTHFGSTVALFPPKIVLESGGTRKASNGQLWLWKCWTHYWSTVRAIKPLGGGKKWAVHLGDGIEGDHHGTSGIVSKNPVTMLDIAVDVLEPVRQWADLYFQLKGSEAHAGEAGQWDETIAKDLHAEPCKDEHTFSWWYLKLDIQGVLFDFAHQPPSNPRDDHTKGTAAGKLAFTVMQEHAKHGDVVPNWAVRGHVHRFMDSGWTYPTRGVTCPAWQLSTSYSSRRWPGRLSEIGGLLFIIEDGYAVMRRLLYKPERADPWREEQSTQMST